MLRQATIDGEQIVKLTQLAHKDKSSDSWRRLISHWAKEGCLFESRSNKGGMRKLSIVEIAWLRLVIELRKFNLPYEAIRNLKWSLMDFGYHDENDVYFPALLKYFEGVVAEAKSGTPIWKEIKKTERKIKRMKKHPSGVVMYEDLHLLSVPREMALFCNEFSIMLAEACALRLPAYIVVHENGDHQVVSNSNGDFHEIGLRHGSFITVPLTGLISDLLFNPIISEEAPSALTLSDDERQLIEMIRSGEAKKIEVVLSDDRRVTILKEEETLTIDPQTRLSEIIMSGGYQEIRIMVRNGKIVDFKNKKSTKL